jgi:peptidoglycan/LPS O-acetylase OafA/YrhL
MSRFFILAIMTGVVVLIAILLLSLLFFHTIDSPATRFVAPGTFAVPVGFSVQTSHREKSHVHRSKRNRQLDRQR